MRLPALGFVLATPALALLAACGGDDDTPAETDGSAAVDETPADDVAADDAPAEPESAALECPSTISVAGMTPAGTDFEATSAVAASLEGGVAYTLYLADFELTTDSFSMIRNPEVPADGTLWTVAVTIFNPSPEDQARISPIAVGREIQAGEPFGVLTFTVTVQEGETFSGARDGEEGTLTVTGVGDTFCGTIDYADDEKSISGSFVAPTKAL